MSQCLLAGRPTCILQYLDVIIHEEPSDCENITVEVQKGPSSSKPTGFALFDSNTCTNVITEKRRTSVCFGQYKTILWLSHYVLLVPMSLLLSTAMLVKDMSERFLCLASSTEPQAHELSFMFESSTRESQEPTNNI